jgi:carbon monoxide dehydrogenase subunit G
VILEGAFSIKAPADKLFDLLLEPETIQACLPGAEKIERLDERTYDCVVKQKVGPISVRFKFKTVLVKVERPTHLEMEGGGEDLLKGGWFTQRTSIDLVPKENGEVGVLYHCDASITGKLAMFGDRILRAKAKKVEEEFTEALRQRLASLENR